MILIDYLILCVLWKYLLELLEIFRIKLLLTNKLGMIFTKGTNTKKK
jgi:hypothetical protein